MCEVIRHYALSAEEVKSVLQCAAAFASMSTWLPTAPLCAGTALRMDPKADAEGHVDGLTLVFACAVTAGGYWPITSPFYRTATGDTPGLWQGDPAPWYAENVPSISWHLLASLRDLGAELADAVAAALSSD